MRYLYKRKKQIFFCLFLCVSYNLYFIFLLPDVKTEYLEYLDFLLAVCGLFAAGAGFLGDRRKRVKKEKLLKLDTVIYPEFPDMDDYEIAEHDARVLKNELKDQFDANCDMQDYIAKWCHEVKVPLAASLLMNEKIEDARLRAGMQEQLERINQQLKSALLGCKAQGSLFDIQIRSTDLLDCVRTAIRNNRYFLIKNHFRIETEGLGGFVYTDKNWLVYVLDQIAGNAVKYKKCDGGEPVLKFWSEKEGGALRLFVEDHGEGIEESDLRRIFDKGYTGKNHHNGQYKSTGMGLYMTAKILEKLGHAIFVESEKGEYTRFVIEFYSSSRCAETNGGPF